MMQISQTGINFIVNNEGGYRLVCYKDSAGLLTIGAGHKVEPGENVALGQTCTINQVVGLFAIDSETVVNAINDLLTVFVTQNQFEALCSLVYNIGAEAFKTSTVLREINENDYAHAADAFLLWNKITVNGIKEISAGLVARRERERALFLQS